VLVDLKLGFIFEQFRQGNETFAHLAGLVPVVLLQELRRIVKIL
jgi:hypothetical protein